MIDWNFNSDREWLRRKAEAEDGTFVSVGGFLIKGTNHNLRVVPVTLAQANAFVRKNHRHHAPVVGHRWSIGLNGEHGLCGVAICGRPKARLLPQDTIIEINRVATDGTKNACSKLYGTCAAIAKLMGFTDIETAILETEPGTSLRAAGFTFRRMTAGGDWNRPSRGCRRRDQPMGPKQIWGKVLNQ